MIGFLTVVSNGFVVFPLVQMVKTLNEKDQEGWFDIWFQGRFGYLEYALKIGVGSLVTMFLLQWLKPDFLIKVIEFPEAVTMAHCLAYITAFSIITLLLYFSGEMYIKFLIKISKTLFKLMNKYPSPDGEKLG